MINCPAFVQGCPYCDLERQYEEGQGHDCGPEEDSRFKTLCAVWGDMRRRDEEFHKLSHEPERCEGCRAILADRVGYDVFKREACPSGLCVWLYCPYCSWPHSSFGSIGCRACTRPARRSERIRRMHRSFPAKARFTRAGRRG